MYRGVFTAVVLALSACAAFANDKVSLYLEWAIDGDDVGYFMAAKRGYFAEQGIDINIIAGTGSAKSIAVVSTEGATFGLADGTSVVNAVAQGVPVKFIAADKNRSPFAVCARKDRGIAKLSDLEGKTIAFTAGTSYAFFFPALLKANGIDASKIRMVNMDGAAALGSVIDGRVDGQLGGVDTQAVAPEDNGVAMVIMPGSALGLKAIGRGIIASNATIANHPDLVRRFLVAVRKGYEDAKVDLDAATAAVLEAQDPATRMPLWYIKRQAEINFQEVMIPAEGKPFMALDEKALLEQIDMMKKYGDLKADRPLADYYAQQFEAK